MPFQPGRTKTGGRKKGSINSITRTVMEICERRHFSPIEAMIEIAQNEKHPLELRARMAVEIAQYVYPKRRALEHSGPEGEPIRLIVASISDKP